MCVCVCVIVKNTTAPIPAGLLHTTLKIIIIKATRIDLLLL